MELKVQKDSKIVEVWLTNSEKGDEALRERLKPLYQTYKERGYLVAEFRSGGKDLKELTGALLASNRRHMAQQEVRKEHQQIMELTM